MQPIILHMNGIVGDKPGSYEFTKNHNMLWKKNKTPKIIHMYKLD